MHCGCKYTPEPKQHGHSDEVRKQAVQFYVDGMNLRRIGRHLGIHHRTVSLWVKASDASLPEVPVPKEVKTAEMDELFTFIGNKNTRSTYFTIVDRQTRCYLSWKGFWERTRPAIQEMIGEAPRAKIYRRQFANLSELAPDMLLEAEYQEKKSSVLFFYTARIGYIAK